MREQTTRREALQPVTRRRRWCAHSDAAAAAARAICWLSAWPRKLQSTRASGKQVTVQLGQHGGLASAQHGSDRWGEANESCDCGNSCVALHDRVALLAGRVPATDVKSIVKTSHASCLSPARSPCSLFYGVTGGVLEGAHAASEGRVEKAMTRKPMTAKGSAVEQ